MDTTLKCNRAPCLLEGRHCSMGGLQADETRLLLALQCSCPMKGCKCMCSCVTALACLYSAALCLLCITFMDVISRISTYLTSTPLRRAAWLCACFRFLKDDAQEAEAVRQREAAADEERRRKAAAVREALSQKVPLLMERWLAQRLR